MFSALHDQARRMLEQAAELTPWNAMSVEDARLAFLARARAATGDSPNVGETRDIRIPRAAGDIPARLYVPEGHPVGTLLYFHGGGFVMGSVESHDALCRYLCHHGTIQVLSVEYRLAPEHPFPAAANDAMTAASWLIDRGQSIGVDPARLAIGGDSAGANLATGVCQAFRDRGGQPFLHQSLIYPMIDLKLSQPSHEMFSQGYRLTLAALQWFVDLYVPQGHDVTAARVSPLFADSLANLPPAFVLTAGFDPLHDEGKLYAKALAEAGVQTRYVCFEDMIHGFCNMPGVFDRAREALVMTAGEVGAAFA